MCVFFFKLYSNIVLNFFLKQIVLSDLSVHCTEVGKREYKETRYEATATCQAGDSDL